MKAPLTALVLLAAGSVAAQPFDFQRQFGSEEYVQGYDAKDMHFAEVSQRDFTPSLTALMLASDVDGIAPNAFSGEIVKSGPSRISLYEVMRDSPEGIAYRDYHERYPADTDWAKVAREWRAAHGNDGLAADEKAGQPHS